MKCHMDSQPCKCPKCAEKNFGYKYIAFEGYMYSVMNFSLYYFLHVKNVSHAVGAFVTGVTGVIFSGLQDKSYRPQDFWG